MNLNLLALTFQKSQFLIVYHIQDVQQSAEGIYKKLGPNTITTIEENPYILIDLTVRVNFAQIDQIAIKMGMDLENDKRIRSGIKYALKLSTNNGHCAVLYENLIQFVKDLLNVSEVMIENNIIFLKTIVIGQKHTVICHQKTGYKADRRYQ